MGKKLPVFFKKTNKTVAEIGLKRQTAVVMTYETRNQALKKKRRKPEIAGLIKKIQESSFILIRKG